MTDFPYRGVLVGGPGDGRAYSATVPRLTVPTDIAGKIGSVEYTHRSVGIASRVVDFWAPADMATDEALKEMADHYLQTRLYPAGERKPVGGIGAVIDAIQRLTRALQSMGMSAPLAIVLEKGSKKYLAAVSNKDDGPPTVFDVRKSRHHIIAGVHIFEDHPENLRG